MKTLITKILVLSLFVTLMGGFVAYKAGWLWGKDTAALSGAMAHSKDPQAASQDTPVKKVTVDSFYMDDMMSSSKSGVVFDFEDNPQESNANQGEGEPSIEEERSTEDMLKEGKLPPPRLDDQKDLPGELAWKKWRRYCKGLLGGEASPANSEPEEDPELLIPSSKSAPVFDQEIDR